MSRPSLSIDNLRIPHGAAPKIDGSVGAAEWKGACKVEVSKTEAIYLTHDGADVYLGIRTERAGFGSVHIQRGDELLVLHASASLGTARYTKTKDGWVLDSGFEFKRPSAQYAIDKWTSSTMTRDSTGMEFRIARELLKPTLTEASSRKPAKPAAKNAPEKPLAPPARLQVVYGIPGAPMLQWPVRMADSKGGPQLVMGQTPRRLDFAPEHWRVLELVAPPEKTSSR